MNKRFLFVLGCTLLLFTLISGTTAQTDDCTIDFGSIQATLANAQSAFSQGDLQGALGYLDEIQTLIRRVEDSCRGATNEVLNWCYTGQPWGDGRCNTANLSQAQINWYWTCGWYWAQHEAGLLGAIPEECDTTIVESGGAATSSNTETDADGDGTPDNYDHCPNDPGKTAPGFCGCGVADTDANSDGIPDCNDQCPTDPNKSAPGVCGCGTPDSDSDSDGNPDCFDQCPNDPNKIAPGICGCGTSDADSDGDGTLDCFDQCPNDPNKTEPGICFCGLPDIDTDGDSFLDCNDECPNNPYKIYPGDCGCDVIIESDWDGDGIPDCIDSCAYVPGTPPDGCP